MEDENVLEEQNSEDIIENPNDTPTEEILDDSSGNLSEGAGDDQGSGDDSSGETDSESDGDGEDSGDGESDGDDQTDDSDDNQEEDDDDGVIPETVDLVELLGLTEIPMSIPIEFLFVYNKLLLVMIELGESMLLDCKALCSQRNMPIVECYHMFKAALAAKQLAYANATEGETVSNYYNKLANTLLNYVKEQLNCITRNYSDDLSFTLPIGSNGLVNLFITKNDVNTEIIVQGSDVKLAEAIVGMQRDVINGAVVTEESTETYDLTEEELTAHKHWHILNSDNEFLPGTSAVYLNGVRYFLHVNYEEWIVTENGTDKGVGIILTNLSFDVADSPDHVYVEAKLLPHSQTE